MATILLTTKLYIPPVRSELVVRPRLIERLNAGLARKLMLVSAPAGYGKTTLLAEWIAQVRNRVAWLSLDEGDNDPARFLSYFVAALQAVEASVQVDVPGALQSLSLEAAMTVLINQVAQVPGQLIFVLDDYHLITTQPVHDALAFVLDHLPDNLHLVIASRADPPLPVARLRARGQLIELRQADLRFTSGEATEFLNRMMGLGLSTDDVAALASRTEGWIAGLQLAAVSMQRRDDAAGFVRSFTGSNRYVLDYLVEEVLQRQPPHIQAFLLQTSILDRLCAPLCDAVRVSEPTSQREDTPIRSFADSQLVLEYLDRTNLFVVPLDDRREWYRYHRLFADLLRARLHQQVGMQGLAPLHRRASVWYEQNGLLAEAIEHALSAEDFERAASLVEQAAEAALMRSEVATFLRWVDALPDDLVRVRPSLCVYHAWALLVSGHPWATIESRLQDVDETDRAPGEAAALRAFISIFRGQVARATELSHRALEQLPTEDRFSRGIAAWSMALSQFAEGDAVAGRQMLDEVIRVGQGTGNVMLVVFALCHLAELAIAQGELHKAQALYEQALALATDAQGQPLPIAGMALIGLGELAREWNDFDAALRYLTEGIALAGRWSLTGTMDAHLSLARLRQAQGDADGARHEIQRAADLAARFDVTEFDDLTVALVQAQLWVAQGERETAWRWVEERQVEQDIEPVELLQGEVAIDYRLRKYEQLVLARLLLSESRFTEALALLDRVQAKMEQRGRPGRVAEVLALKALAFQALGDTAQVLACLEQALALAEPEGYVRLFLDEGEPMAALLRVAAERGIAPDYVARLLAASGGAGEQRGRGVGERKISSAPSHLCPPALPETLSEREIQVLRLLAAGMSSTEMTEHLVISVNTVRTHVKSIYAKLGVHRRLEAVRRAEELGLV